MSSYINSISKFHKNYIPDTPLSATSSVSICRVKLKHCRAERLLCHAHMTNDRLICAPVFYLFSIYIPFYIKNYNSCRFQTQYRQPFMTFNAYKPNRISLIIWKFCIYQTKLLGLTSNQIDVPQQRSQIFYWHKCLFNITGLYSIVSQNVILIPCFHGSIWQMPINNNFKNIYQNCL